MTHIIAEPCIEKKNAPGDASCGASCVDVCPVDCIYGADESWEQVYIHPEECIDCSLCVDACPVEAIIPVEEVPEKWDSFTAKNYEHFGLEAP